MPRQDLTGADRTWAERYEVRDVLRCSSAGSLPQLSPTKKMSENSKTSKNKKPASIAEIRVATLFVEVWGPPLLNLSLHIA